MKISNDYSALKVTTDPNNIVTVKMNRPELHNAFNPQLISELTSFFKNINDIESAAVVILTGEGKSFCAGADINWMSDMVNYSYEENIEDSQKLADMFFMINECKKPVIAKINGAAFGGGVGLVACCDIAIASEGAKFSFSEVKLGIIPAVVSPYVLAKIGPGHGRRLFVTGEIFDAVSAEKIGLVHRIVAPDALDSEVSAFTEMLLNNGPTAMYESKKLVGLWSEMSPDEFRKYTVFKIAELRTSQEGSEGLKAFLSKREPSFRR